MDILLDILEFLKGVVLHPDVLLAIGLLLGVMIASVGSVKHRFGLEVGGVVMAVMCLVMAMYWFRG